MDPNNIDGYTILFTLKKFEYESGSIKKRQCEY
jgi:hypothetical protein